MAVGTFGIANDARIMAYAVGRQLKFSDHPEVELDVSAGPATVVLFTVEKEKVDEVKLMLRKPIAVIGEII
jgi:hypothetical protein